MLNTHNQFAYKMWFLLLIAQHFLVFSDTAISRNKWKRFKSLCPNFSCCPQKTIFRRGLQHLLPPLAHTLMYISLCNCFALTDAPLDCQNMDFSLHIYNILCKSKLFSQQKPGCHYLFCYAVGIK